MPRVRYVQRPGEWLPGPVLEYSPAEVSAIYVLVGGATLLVVGWLMIEYAVSQLSN